MAAIPIFKIDIQQICYVYKCTWPIQNSLIIRSDLKSTIFNIMVATFSGPTLLVWNGYNH